MSFKVIGVITTPEGEDIFVEKTVDFNDIPKEVADIIKDISDKNVEYCFYMEDKKGYKTFLINSDIAKTIKKRMIRQYIDYVLAEYIFPEFLL